MSARILAFAGSTRKDSFNKKVLAIAIQGAEGAGAQVTVLDLSDLPLPLFDQDLEAEGGLPANARKVKDLMIAHDGFLIACPEYNSSITPILKNTIDWASRPVKGEASLVCFSGKTVGLVAASPGALGGLRGLVSVRSILGNIGCLVLPDQVAVSKAHEAIGPDGRLADLKMHAAVEAVGSKLATCAGKLKASAA